MRISQLTKQMMHDFGKCIIYPWRDLSSVFISVSFQSTSAYQEYFAMVAKDFPRITEFLETLRQRQRNALRGRTGAYPQSQAGRSTATSNATSGISSMQPSERRRSSRRSAGNARKAV